jgi:NMD protein affecting ribosome stability and mRNA decay
MSNNVHLVNDPVQDPEDWSFLIECAFCPYCGYKAPEGSWVELHVFSHQVSVAFHHPATDPNVFCEIPEGWVEDD